MEVNTARCYNWDVKRRRDKRIEVAGERISSTKATVPVAEGYTMM